MVAEQVTQIEELEDEVQAKEDQVLRLEVNLNALQSAGSRDKTVCGCCLIFISVTLEYDIVFLRTVYRFCFLSRLSVE